MAKIDKFGAICGEFANIADFITIYVDEAHPYDSGDLTDDYKYRYNTHQKMQDRIEAAQGLANEFQACPILVDLMDNRASSAYGALPERLYILLNGKIVYIGDMGPFGYKLEEIESWLQKYQN